MIQHPDRTCALVTGIESYGLGKDWDLPGARIGAELFVKWLEREGVDPKRIYFQLNAKADDIRVALHKLKQEQQDCDCLVLYWAGHGFETEYDDRSVFLADATEIAPKAIKIDEIISYFRNETAQFTTQLGIIDTCATGRRSAQAIFEPIQMTRQIPQSPGDCRFVLAAPSGLETDYPDDGKASVFSRRLLELLDKGGMTTEGLIDDLKADYPIFVRDSRARYWSGSQARSDTWALEREVFRIGTSLHLDDAKWRAEARRLDATLDLPNAEFRALVEKISGWERKLAGKICAALLLRGAAAGKLDVRDAIRNCPLLASSYEDAAKIVENLRAFENPSYLIKTDYRPSNELGVTGVWFLSGAERCEPQRVFESAPVAAFEEAIRAVTDHMAEYEISSQSVIHVVAPLRFLLDPQQDILENESNYPLVFRERKRAEGLEGFRNLRPKFRDQLLELKQRAAQDFRLAWFETTDKDKWNSVELPALRTGNCANAEEHVERLLQTLVPFAAITRFSIKSLAAADETELALAIGNEKQFANIPVRIHKGRNKAGSILPHITIIWDDRELPKGYFH